jgi:hypothetical protein
VAVGHVAGGDGGDGGDPRRGGDALAQRTDNVCRLEFRILDRFFDLKRPK